MGDVTGYSQIIAKGTWSWLQEPMAYQQQSPAWNENPPAWVSVPGVCHPPLCPHQWGNGPRVLSYSPPCRCHAAHSLECCRGHSRDTSARAGSATLAVHQGRPCGRVWHLVKRAAVTKNLSTFIPWVGTFWHSNKIPAISLSQKDKFGTWRLTRCLTPTFRWQHHPA